MKYKLLVLDVDGTLLNDAKEISKRTLASLLKVQQMGIRVALASGRPTYGLMPLALSLIHISQVYSVTYYTARLPLQWNIPH